MYKNEKIRSYRKSDDFCNKLQRMSPLKPTSSTPTDIKLCVVDVMRALRLILYWPQRLPNYAVKIYLENLTGSILHDALDDYSPGNENILKKIVQKV